MLKRDVPMGAAIIIVALVLLASIVTGHEGEGTAPQVAANKAVCAPPIPAPSATAADFEIEKLNRTRRETSIVDVFASVTVVPPPAPPPAAVKPAPPPLAPTAPPLPFKFIGRLADGDKLVAFLDLGGEALSVSTGDAVQNTYRVERITEGEITFTYLPLGTQQKLTLSAPN